MIELLIHSDGSESVPYRSRTFPLHLSTCSLSMYPGMTCLSHWHADHEFIAVHTGRCIYRVNGLPIMLSAGEGLYVAPRNVHSVEAVNREDCEYLCAVFPTALLSASAYMADRIQAHLKPHEAARCLHLIPSVPRHREIIRDLLRLRHIVERNEQDMELQCMGALYQLIADLGRAVQGESALPKADRHLAQIKDCIRYIRLHADRKITLADIAQAGRLSRSSCESAFERVLHISPIRYLINCRLEKGMELLMTTSLSVTEIAYACGFCSGSYFTEQFCKRSGCTPGDFRQKRRPPPETSKFPP